MTRDNSGILTAKGLRALKPGEWTSDPAARGAGRLQARRTAAGTVTFYYRYTAPSGERVRIPIAGYDETGRNGLTLIEARDRAGDLSRRYRAGERDLREAMAEDEAATAAKRESKRRQDESDAARKAGTLGALLSTYADALKAEGKPSWRAVAAMMQRHVKTRHAKLWAKPAVDVTPEDGIALIGPLAHAGKLREAAKLRSYLRAAFSVAIRSHTDPKAAPELRKLGIRANPFSDLATIAGATKAGERALSVAELRAYWKQLAALPASDSAQLRFHLLTGGQRLEQLARVTTADFDTDLTAITLRDPKGRRKQPRPHVVPLIHAAVEAMQAMQGGALGDYVFTTNGGESGARYGALQRRLRSIVAAMEKAKELEKGPFTLGDLRRTVETRLAALGVSMEVRAQLQSHGLGGVQSRHYDKHDYLVEKRNALSILHALVTSQPGKVTSIREREKSGTRR